MKVQNQSSPSKEQKSKLTLSYLNISINRLTELGMPRDLQETLQREKFVIKLKKEEQKSAAQVQFQVKLMSRSDITKYLDKFNEFMLYSLTDNAYIQVFFFALFLPSGPKQNPDEKNSEHKRQLETRSFRNDERKSPSHSQGSSQGIQVYRAQKIRGLPS